MKISLKKILLFNLKADITKVMELLIKQIYNAEVKTFLVFIFMEKLKYFIEKKIYIRVVRSADAVTLPL